MPEQSEDYPRDKQIAIKKYTALKNMLTGPMEIIYNQLKVNDYASPLRIDKKMHDYGFGFSPQEQRVFDNSGIVDIIKEIREKEKKRRFEQQVLSNVYDEEASRPAVEEQNNDVSAMDGAPVSNAFETLPNGYVRIKKHFQNDDFGWGEHKAMLDRNDKQRKDFLERLEREEAEEKNRRFWRGDNPYNKNN